MVNKFQVFAVIFPRFSRNVADLSEHTSERHTGVRSTMDLQREWIWWREDHQLYPHLVLAKLPPTHQFDLEIRNQSKAAL